MGCSCGAGDHLEGESTQTLREHVDANQSSVLNAVRPWDLLRVLDGACVLRSDVDDEILVRVVFSGAVKLTHIGVPPAIGVGSASHPNEMLVFANQPDTDFDKVASGLAPTATYALVPPGSHASPVLYPTRAVRFSHTTSVCVLLRGAAPGARAVAVGGLQLYGAFKAGRVGAVRATYEARPLVADHAPAESSVMRSIL